MLYFLHSVVARTRVIVAEEQWDPEQQMCPGPGHLHLTGVPVSKQMGLLLLSIDGIDKTRRSCPWNSDQNYTQISAREWWGSRGYLGRGWQGSRE